NTDLRTLLSFPTRRSSDLNPTHYAVAIRYSEKDARAPYVVAKGIDEIALRIKGVAQRHQIEVLEVPVLARAIYYSTRVDQEVPKDRKSTRLNSSHVKISYA